MNGRLLNFWSASIFKVLDVAQKLVKMLSEYQTTWIRVRPRVTRRLIRIQAVLHAWHFGCAWRAKAGLITFFLKNYTYHEIINSNKINVESIHPIIPKNWKYFFESRENYTCLKNKNIISLFAKMLYEMCDQLFPPKVACIHAVTCIRTCCKDFDSKPWWTTPC